MPPADGNLPQPSDGASGPNDPPPAFIPPAADKDAIPGAPPPSREASPYDFFLDSGSREGGAKNGSGFQVPQNPGTQMMLLIGGGAALVIIILIVLLFVPNKDPKAALITVNQVQTETLRLCTAGRLSTKFKDMRNFATNCELSMTTQTAALTGYLKKSGANIKGKVLAQGHNAKSDKTLAAATASSNYDSAFKQVMTDQLNTQERVIQTAYNAGSTTTSEKTRLKEYSDDTKLLQQQLGN